MKKAIFLPVILLTSSYVQAQDEIRWDSASVSYLSSDEDGRTFNGYALSASKLFTEHFFITGGYSSVSDSEGIPGAEYDLDIQRFSVGLGYRYPIFHNMDIYTLLSYRDKKVDGSGEILLVDEEYNGEAVLLGFRGLITKNIELQGAVNYSSLPTTSKGGVNLSAMYHFSQDFSLSLGYEKLDNIDTVSLSGVYFF